MEQKLKKLEESLEKGDDEVISDTDLQRELDKRQQELREKKEKEKRKIDNRQWQKKKELEEIEKMQCTREN